jgi:hypothetical protein
LILDDFVANDKCGYGERYLEEKTPPPADLICDGATQGRARDGTKAKDSILHSLIHASPSKRDHVGVDDGRFQLWSASCVTIAEGELTHRHQTTSPKASQGSHAVEKNHITCKRASKASQRKGSRGNEEAWSPSEDVGYATIQGLKSRAGNEI